MSEFENKNTQPELPAEEFTSEQKSHMVKMTLLRHQITAHDRKSFGRLNYAILPNAVGTNLTSTTNDPNDRPQSRVSSSVPSGK
jgi:hypothetical protein